MGELEDFFDILLPRKEERYNMLWSFRKLKPKVAFEHKPRPTPHSLKEAVLKFPAIVSLLSKLKKDLNISPEELEKQAKLIIDEIGYEKSLLLLRWLSLVFIKIVSRVSSGLLVHERSILHVKDKIGQYPTVFIPSHRSYADFILMSYICFNYDIAVPAIASGMDFQGMMGMGTMLRHTGAFYIRRSYDSDQLYWSIFKEYIHQLVISGELPLEFFIEGTRSRTGKSLTPKFGLMNMILRAFFLSEVPDILLVPINISYDRVLEEKLFAFELLGVPKPKESTSGFFKSLKIMQENYGKCYIHFAEPISVHEYFRDKVNRSVHSTGPVSQGDIVDEEKSLLPHLASEIIERQQKNCVITVFNIIAIIFNNDLVNLRNNLNLIALKLHVKNFKLLLANYGALVNINNIEEDIMNSLEIHSNIIGLEDNTGKLELVSHDIILDKNYEKKLKGHALSSKTMTFSVPYVMLQLYINPVMHYLIDSCIVITILEYTGNAAGEKLFEYYLFLRRLFSNEFVSHETKYLKAYDNAVSKLEFLGIVKNNGYIYELGDSVIMKEIFICLLQPFVFTYYVIFTILTQTSDWDETTIMRLTQKNIENMMEQKEIFIHPYSLSLDMISNCLTSLVTLGRLKRSKNENQVMYQILECVRNDLALLERFLPDAAVQMIKQIKVTNLSLKNKL